MLDARVSYTSFTYTGSHGQTYYAKIKAKDRAGNISLYSDSSGGIKIDLTPPSTPVVADDGKWTTDGTKLHAMWLSMDMESDIAEYKYAIGKTPGASDVVG